MTCTADLLCSQGGGVQSCIHLAQLATHCKWITPNANHTADRRRKGYLTHASKNKDIVSKKSITLVDGLPMLLLGMQGAEPTLLEQARGTLNHLDEVLTNICLTVASATTCHQPRFDWGFQHMIGGHVSLPSLQISQHSTTTLHLSQPPCSEPLH